MSSKQSWWCISWHSPGSWDLSNGIVNAVLPGWLQAECYCFPHSSHSLSLALVETTWTNFSRHVCLSSPLVTSSVILLLPSMMGCPPCMHSTVDFYPLSSSSRCVSLAFPYSYSICPSAQLSPCFPCCSSSLLINPLVWLSLPFTYLPYCPDRPE